MYIPTYPLKAQLIVIQGRITILENYKEQKIICQSEREDLKLLKKSATHIEKAIECLSLI